MDVEAQEETDPFAKFSNDEIEGLRQALLNKIKVDLTDSYYFRDTVSLLRTMRDTSWIPNFMKIPFKKLPTVIHKCPKLASPLWYDTILNWRFQIGK